ncbi:MAG TPA: hypothetical protein VGY94_00280, partial [Acidobacteriaceae bacterium]|nr:hypothetical protein [Acidobacteriaceae bacterium]
MTATPGASSQRGSKSELRNLELHKLDIRKLDILVQTGLLLTRSLDLQSIVQCATDAGLQLSGAQFGAFFYNVINDEGESYLLYTLSGVSREKFAHFPMPRNTAVFGPTFEGQG